MSDLDPFDPIPQYVPGDYIEPPGLAAPKPLGIGPTLTTPPESDGLLPALASPRQIQLENPYTGQTTYGGAPDSTLGAPQIGDASNPYHQFGMQTAQKYGVPWELMFHQIGGESGWNPKVRKSSAGAQGIAQFIPSTAKQYGVDVNDPFSGIEGNARYMSDLYKEAGSWTGALTGYLTGKPGGPIPTSVLRSNPSYAEAYRVAQRLDSGGVGLQASQGPVDPIDPEATYATRLAAAGRSPQGGPVDLRGNLAAGGAPAVGGVPSTQGATLAKSLGQALQQGASQSGAGSMWEKLMVLSMIRQLTSQGTHQFVPITYDPFKYAPVAGVAASSRHLLRGAKGEVIGEV